MKLSPASISFLEELASGHSLTYSDLAQCVNIWESEHDPLTEGLLRGGRWKYGGKPASIAALDGIIANSTATLSDGVSNYDILRIHTINQDRITRFNSSPLRSSRSDVETIFYYLSQVLLKSPAIQEMQAAEKKRNITAQYDVVKSVDDVMSQIHAEWLQKKTDPILPDCNGKIVSFFEKELIARSAEYTMDGKDIAKCVVTDRWYVSWHLEKRLGYNCIQAGELPDFLSEVILQRVMNFNETPSQQASRSSI